jgi:hypothetical protein
MSNVLLTQVGVVNDPKHLREFSMHIYRPIHRSFVISVCLATSLGAASSVSLGATEITSDMPPPAPRVEITPAARDGFVWSPGYWDWGGHAYYWVPGSWVVQRRGAHYVANQWEQTGNQWHFLRGHWER